MGIDRVRHSRTAARIRTSTLAATVLLGLLVSGCSIHGLNFVEDSRVRITAPGDRARVPLPVTVAWDVSDFAVTGPTEHARPDAGYFAVFIDRSPQPAGEPLAWLAREDAACLSEPDCPDEEWLAQRGVHVTTEASVTLDTVPRRSDRARDLHEVTVVLLDGTGRRLGESAWSVDLEVARN